MVAVRHNSKYFIVSGTVLAISVLYPYVPERLQPALALTSQEVYALTAEASNLVRTRNFAAAQQKLSLILKQYPDSWQATYSMGLCFEDKGKNDAAIEWYRKAANLAPQRHDTLTGIARIY